MEEAREKLTAAAQGSLWIRNAGNPGGGSATPDVSWQFSAVPMARGTIGYIVFLCALWGGNMVAIAGFFWPIRSRCHSSPALSW
jgi:hypothetical protein